MGCSGSRNRKTTDYPQQRNTTNTTNTTTNQQQHQHQQQQTLNNADPDKHHHQQQQQQQPSSLAEKHRNSEAQPLEQKAPTTGIITSHTRTPLEAVVETRNCSCTSLAKKQDDNKATEVLLAKKRSEKHDDQFYADIKNSLWITADEPSSIIDFGNLHTGVLNINSSTKLHILLVFAKPGKQYRSVCSAASPNAGFTYETAQTDVEALALFDRRRPHVVIIDARCSKHLDAIDICRKLRVYDVNNQCVIVALTQRMSMNHDEPSMKPLFEAGFNTRIVAPSGRMAWLNELQILRHGLVKNQFSAVTMASLFKVVDNINTVAVTISGHDHKILFANQYYEQIFGYKSGEALNRRDDEDLSTEAKNVVNQKMLWYGKNEFRKKNGDLINRNLHIFPVTNHLGEIWHYVSLYTEPRNLENKTQSHMSHNTLRRGSLSESAAITKVTCILEEIRAEADTTKQSDSILLVIEMLEAIDGLSQHLRPRQVKGDQMTTELVGGLITMPKIIREIPQRMSNISKSKLSRIPTVSENEMRNSLRVRSSMPNETLPELNAEMIATLQEALTWKMDIIKLEKITGSRPLLYLGWQVLQAFSILDFLKVSESVVINWLTEMEANYHADNPYHNSTHAADVMQATAFFLNTEPCKYVFDDLESIAAILAAIVHDLDHPGKTNAFLVNARFPLAVLYNDSAVLESHHISLCFQIMANHSELDIFKQLNRDDYMAVRQTMIDMVLATDMTKHFEHLNKFHVFMSDIPKEDVGEDKISIFRMPESRTIIKRLIIKCADVSNPVRPLHICQTWASRIADEYCAQTCEEKKRCIPIIMPIFDDRKTCNVPKSQTSFIDFFINDLYNSFNSLCKLPELMDLLTTNYRHWKLREIEHLKALAGGTLLNNNESLTHQNSIKKPEGNKVEDVVNRSSNNK